MSIMTKIVSLISRKRRYYKLIKCYFILKVSKYYEIFNFKNHYTYILLSIYCMLYI